MKKIITVALSKSYQKVELSVEVEIADAMGNTMVSTSELASIKAELLNDAQILLQEALVKADLAEKNHKTLETISVPTQKPTGSYQAPQGSNYNGEKTLSEKQIFQLKKHNLYFEGITYAEGKDLLDKAFSNNNRGDYGKQQYNNNNNFNKR